MKTLVSRESRTSSVGAPVSNRSYRGRGSKTGRAQVEATTPLPTGSSGVSFTGSGSYRGRGRTSVTGWSDPICALL